MVLELDECPECGAQWAYEVDGQRFSHLVGLYDRDLDRVYAWMCEQCREQWPRGAHTPSIKETP